MSTDVENTVQNTCGSRYGSRNAVPKVEILEEPVKAPSKDYMNYNDKTIDGQKIAKAYQSKLSTIALKNELGTYKEELKEAKKANTLKANAFTAITTGRPVTKKYWDEKLFSHLKNSKFGITEADFEFKTEQRLKKDKDGKTSLVDVQMAYLTNNLKTARENSLPLVINSILEDYEITPELEAELKEVLELLKTKSAKEVEELHTIKANSALIDDAKANTHLDMDIQLKNLDTSIQKYKSKIDFLNWKLKQITIYENNQELLTLEKQKMDMKDKIQARLKKDKKFESIRNVALKWSL